MGDDRQRDPFGYGLQHLEKTFEHPCFECGVPTKGKHHVVPVSRGGSKQLPLCSACHIQAHGLSGTNAFDGKRIKVVLERLRDAGVKLGAPIRHHTKVEEALMLRLQGLSYSAIAKRLGVSVGWVHKTTKRSEAGTNQSFGG